MKTETTLVTSVFNLVLFVWISCHSSAVTSNSVNTLLKLRDVKVTGTIDIHLSVENLHSKRVKMRTTLETSEDENYTRNEWRRWELHSKRVKMRTTLEIREGDTFMRSLVNHWAPDVSNICWNSLHSIYHKSSSLILHSKRVKLRSTLETSEAQKYTRNEWNPELHSKRVKPRTTLGTSVVTVSGPPRDCRRPTSYIFYSLFVPTIAAGC